MSDTTRVCGFIGPGDPGRVHRMAEMADLDPREQAVISREDVYVAGSAGLTRRPVADGLAWMFSTATPSPSVFGSADVTWEQAARDADVAGVTVSDGGELSLHAGVSGVQPVYVEISGGVVYFATHLNVLLETTTQRVRPDWTGWAQIIGLGAPLAGRTTVEEIKRLNPMEQVRLRPGQSPKRSMAVWPWEQVTPEAGVDPRSLTGEVLDAMREQIKELPETPLQPMLSGGRDSRLLAGLACELTGPNGGGVDETAPNTLTAWTTSSDTGTTLEELTAARVASRMEISHRIVPARHDAFSQDFRDYAKVTGYQASFHIWLMPVARELAKQRGTVLDGLGGGVFLGGGFPDRPGSTSGGLGEVVEGRFSRLSRYLQVAEELLAPGVGDMLTARSREDFNILAEPLAEHPQGATLTAYLTRTLPGISMAPAAVLGGSLPTAVPMMSHAVVSQALRLTHGKKRDGAWYPDLLRRVRPEFAEIPTAADLTVVRQHVRRGASVEAATWYRSLILGSPVAELLGERLRHGEPRLWQRQLERTRAQHLIRGLALLALWLDQYSGKLVDVDVAALHQGERKVGRL